MFSLVSKFFIEKSRLLFKWLYKCMLLHKMLVLGIEKLNIHILFVKVYITNCFFSKLIKSQFLRDFANFLLVVTGGLTFERICWKKTITFYVTPYRYTYISK